MQGQLLGERYELLERLAPAGAGERWRAYDRQLGAPVEAAVLAGPGAAPEEAARLAEAARAAAERPDHPHLVTVLDAGTDPASGTVYAVLEQVAGRSLEEALAADGLPGAARAAEWARQICAGLAASHAAGTVHRDLRPAHLLLAADGTVKLPGLAVDVPETGQPGSGPSGALAGVPWMSPELVRGAEHVDERSDLYAVGCLLYQLLTGKPPFGHREPTVQFGAHLREAPAPPSSRQPGVPAGLDELVLQLLAKAPEERPASADEVLDRLDALGPEVAAAGSGPAGFAAPAHEPAAPAAPAGSVGSAVPSAGFPAAASFSPVPQSPAPAPVDLLDPWEDEHRTSWWQGSAGRRAGLVAGSAALALALVSGITWAVSAQGGKDGGPTAAGASAGASSADGGAGSTGEVPADGATWALPSTDVPSGSAAASASATGTTGAPGASAGATPGAPGTAGGGGQPGTTPAPGTAPATPGTPTTAGPTTVPPSPATSAGTYGCSGGLIGSYPVTTASGVVFGYFYIWFDSASGKNCAATIKTVNSGYGTASAVSASISRCSQTTAAASCSKVAGTTATDQGSFAKFAGPVRVAAVKTCINGSGSITWAGQTATTRSLGNRAVHCG
ncbi:serine/threonine-protein kinase [Kitasatospora sp. NPDC085895]|uniref:serine/threonine-protein kinase n=1 Tax=Kitasatospora sp. NPDC085895 TaxID=3155057 RepID=UPI00344FD5E7